MLTLLGILLTATGLFIVYIQVRRSISSAESARVAANEAKTRITGVYQILDFSVLQALALETVNHIRHDNWSGASLRASDLRNGIAKQRKLDEESKLLSKQKWQGAITIVAEIETAMFELTKDGNAEVDVAACIKSLQNIGELFSGATAEVASRAQGG